MTALNERALELAAAAIAAEMNKDDLPAGGWSELCRLSARAAIEAYHASEPDAEAGERAELERIGKLLNSYDAATAEPMVALANYGEIALQILRGIRARSQP